jgi:hypothetical protein
VQTLLNNLFANNTPKYTSFSVIIGPFSKSAAITPALNCNPTTTSFQSQPVNIRLHNLQPFQGPQSHTPSARPHSGCTSRGPSTTSPPPVHIRPTNLLHGGYQRLSGAFSQTEHRHFDVGNKKTLPTWGCCTVVCASPHATEITVSGKTTRGICTVPGVDRYACNRCIGPLGRFLVLRGVIVPQAGCERRQNFGIIPFILKTVF